MSVTSIGKSHRRKGKQFKLKFPIYVLHAWVSKEENMTALLSNVLAAGPCTTFYSAQLMRKIERLF